MKQDRGDIFSTGGLGQKAAGAMFWNFVGKFTLMVLKYAESIVLLRLLGAEEYGALSATLGVHALGLMLTSLGMGSAVLKFLPEVREKGDEARFLAGVLWVRFGLCIIAAGALIALAPFFARHFLHDAQRVSLFYAAGLLVIGTGMQNLLARVLVSRYRQKTLNLIQCAVGALYLALAVAAVLLELGVTGVLFVNAATTAIGAGLIALKVRGAAKGGKGRGDDKTLWRRLRRFSATFFLYDILNFILEKPLDVLMIGLLHPDLRQVAFYVLAYNFAHISLNVFTKVFAEGLTLSMVSEVFAAGDEGKLRRIYGAVFEYLYLFITPIVAGGLVLGDDLMRLMYGKEGVGAVGPALTFLAVGYLGKYQGITANFLGGMNRERSLIASRLIFAGLNVVLNLILIPGLGAWGACLSTCAATLAGLVYESKLLHKVLSPAFPKVFLLKVLASAGVMSAGVFALCLVLPDSDLFRVLVGLPAGVGIYALCLIVAKPISPPLLELIRETKAPGAKLVAGLLMPRKPGGES